MLYNSLAKGMYLTASGSNGVIGRRLLPHLRRVLLEYDELGKSGDSPDQTPIFRHALASTLLSASRYSDTHWKWEAITRTRKVLKHDDDPFLNAELAHRGRAVQRMSGDPDIEKAVLCEIFDPGAQAGQQSRQASKKYNAQLGEMIISSAGGLIREGKLQAAEAKLCQWKPLGAPSTLERITLRAQQTNLCKILRLCGVFDLALAKLDSVFRESVGDTFFEGSGWHMTLVWELAGLLCEVGDPVRAERILLDTLEPMAEANILDIRNGRRLRLSLVETYLQRHMFEQAEELLFRLKDAFESDGQLDNLAQESMFRIWMMLARKSHMQFAWSEALSRWRKALSVLESIGYAHGAHAVIVRKSIGHALWMAGTLDKNQIQRILSPAASDWGDASRIYWEPRFDSAWHDHIEKALQDVGKGPVRPPSI